MRTLHYGLSTGKYKNPFVTITTKQRTLVFEIHTCFSTLFKFKKMTDNKNRGFYHVTLSIFSITNFTH